MFYLWSNTNIFQSLKSTILENLLLKAGVKHYFSSSSISSYFSSDKFYFFSNTLLLFG